MKAENISKIGLITLVIGIVVMFTPILDNDFKAKQSDHVITGIGTSMSIIGVIIVFVGVSKIDTLDINNSKELSSTDLQKKALQNNTTVNNDE